VLRLKPGSRPTSSWPVQVLQVRTLQDGRCSIGSLPTSEFFLAVVPYSGEFFVFSPPVLEQIAPLAIRVALEKGKTVTQDLKIPGR